MMETILNLVWLAVTIAVICLWRVRWTPLRRNVIYTERLQAIALLCFVALLFPVISLTDDLHPEIMLADAVGVKRSSCLLVAQSVHPRSAAINSVAHIPAGIVPATFAPITLAVAERIPLVKVRLPNSFSGSFAGRSPPLSCNFS